jgi:imidazolonepropionase-like amidohydrolase
MISSLLIALPLALASGPAAPAQATARTASKSEVVAVQAGTIHLVEEGRVIHGGGTVLMRDGRIVAIGKDVEIPLDARVVDYGPDAVIMPGMVAADSPYGGAAASDRTADPQVLAADAFNPFSSYAQPISNGITTVYLAPARGRLIAGQGAVAKLGVEPGSARLLVESCGIHGAIGAEARRTPGYWEPPIPATVDVGLGIEQRQLPRTTMGAILALGELIDAAAGKGDPKEYGPTAGPELARLLKEGKTWRMGAQRANEIRALVNFCREHGLPLVLDGADHAGVLADDLATAGVSVVLGLDVRGNLTPRDQGKGPDAEWPRYDTAAALARAGVTFALVPADRVSRSGGNFAINDLRFVAQIASRNGVGEERALRAVTLDAARILGVADRVGSLAPGKDGDLVVLNGPPLASTSSVLATWIGAEVVWKAHESAATVLHLEHLHLGDGQVLAPGQVLIEDGRVVEVGRRVSHPLGATVIRGHAAMPGMIDARGHLGLEGSSRTPQTRYTLSRIIEPGDATDRRVAKAGVTTVLLTPRGTSRSGAPAMAYKPAGSDVEKMVIAEHAALHFTWSDSNRLKAGEAVRDTLGKARDYKQKWDEYELALAAWDPAEEKPEEAKADGPAAEEKPGEEESAKEEKKDDKKNDKKKKVEARPVTGVWEAEVRASEEDEPARLRLRLLEHGDGSIEGTLRSPLVSAALVSVSGQREEFAVSLSGRSPEGRVEFAGTATEGKLSGKLTRGDLEVAVEGEQKSAQYDVVRRPEPVAAAPAAAASEPKGKPKSPGVNPDLEPLRRALEGKAAVVVGVEREDEILACVKAFEDVGLKPILLGANEAWKVASQIRGRISGVLLDHRVIYSDSEMGTRTRNRYAELANAGIRVAFHSSAEEGAAELPLVAAYAVSQGMSPEGALRALTSDAAEMMAISSRVGRIAPGMDADLLLLDGDPLDIGTRVLRVWVNGQEIR